MLGCGTKEMNLKGIDCLKEKLAKCIEVKWDFVRLTCFNPFKPNGISQCYQLHAFLPSADVFKINIKNSSRNTIKMSNIFRSRSSPMCKNCQQKTLTDEELISVTGLNKLNFSV